MQHTRISVHGVNTDIGSNNQAFLDFAQKYFASKNMGDGGISNTADIRMDIEFQKGFSFRVNKNYTKQVGTCFGENISFSDAKQTFYFGHKELSGHIQFGTDGWRSTIKFQKNIFKHISSLLFFNRGYNNEYYYRLIVRLCVQNIIFLKLKEKYGVDVMSAAAISVQGKSFIFAGLPGSGKSTVVQKIAQNLQGVEVLTENFVLLKDLTILPFTEGKHVTALSPRSITSVFIMSHGEVMSVEKIDKDYAYQCVEAINNFTAEMISQSLFVNTVLFDHRFGFILEDECISNMTRQVDVFKASVDMGCEQFITYLRNTYNLK